MLKKETRNLISTCRSLSVFVFCLFLLSPSYMQWDRGLERETFAWYGIGLNSNIAVDSGQISQPINGNDKPNKDLEWCE